MVSDICL